MNSFFNFYSKKISTYCILILIITTTFVSGCTNEETKESTTLNNIPMQETNTPLSDNNADVYTAAAVETCECMRPMFDLIKNAETGKQKEDDEAILEQEAKIAKVRPQVIGCAEIIRKKYGSMESPQDQRKILDALEKHCPDSYNILNKTISLKF